MKFRVKGIEWLVLSNLALLLIIAILPWSFDFIIPGKEVFCNEIILNASERVIYFNQLTLILIFDFIFIILWGIIWFFFIQYCITQISFRKAENRIIYIIITGSLGILAALCDFGENIFQILMLEEIVAENPVNNIIFSIWSIILFLSYFLMYLALISHFAIKWMNKPDPIKLISPIWELILSLIITFPIIILTLFKLDIAEYLGYIWFVLLFVYIFIVFHKKNYHDSHK